MREIEARHGRDRGGAKVASRTLDLDVLTYGDEVTEDGGKPLPRCSRCPVSAAMRAHKSA